MRKMRIPSLLALLLLGLAVPVLASESPPRPEWLAVHAGDDGKPLLTVTGLPAKRQTEILEWLHTWQRGNATKAPRLHRQDGELFETVTESPYHWRLYLSPFPPGDLRDPNRKLPEILTFESETEVLGQRLTVTTKHGYPFKSRCEQPTTIVRDSLGGRRDECRNRHGLFFTTDGAPLVGVEWDQKEGRPLKVDIGLDMELEYIYPEHPADIEDAFRTIAKRLTTADGKVLGEWTHQDSPRPRPGARLWGTAEQWEGGPQTLIAEWDQALYPDGAGVVSTYGTLGLTPYALLPLGDQGKVWRSVSLPPVGSMQGGAEVFTADRVDYTDTDFRVWLYLTGPAGTVHSVMVEHPRTVTP